MAKRSKARGSRKKQQQQARQNQMIALGVFGLFALGVVALILSGGGGLSAAPEVAQERLELDPVLGNPDAPVTIIEYSAFGCHACRDWHQAGFVENILEEFQGQVNFVQRDFPVIVPSYDQMAANVAQCALDQGQDQFWTMFDALYTRVDVGATQDQLISLGGQIGLDEGRLRDCAEAGTHRATVQYDLDRARSLNLRGTPAFFVNDQQLISPRPQDLRAAVMAALGNG